MIEKDREEEFSYIRAYLDDNNLDDLTDENLKKIIEYYDKDEFVNCNSVNIENMSLDELKKLKSSLNPSKSR